MFVPVKSQEGERLMPTSPSVARHLIKSGKGNTILEQRHILYTIELQK